MHPDQGKTTPFSLRWNLELRPLREHQISGSHYQPPEGSAAAARILDPNICDNKHLVGSLTWYLAAAMAVISMRPQAAHGLTMPSRPFGRGASSCRAVLASFVLAAYCVVWTEALPQVSCDFTRSAQSLTKCWITRTALSNIYLAVRLIPVMTLAASCNLAVSQHCETVIPAFSPLPGELPPCGCPCPWHLLLVLARGPRR